MSKSHRACAVVVTNLPGFTEGDGFRAALDNVVLKKLLGKMVRPAAHREAAAHLRSVCEMSEPWAYREPGVDSCERSRSGHPAGRRRPLDFVFDQLTDGRLRDERFKETLFRSLPPLRYGAQGERSDGDSGGKVPGLANYRMTPARLQVNMGVATTGFSAPVYRSAPLFRARKSPPITGALHGKLLFKIVCRRE